ncbi:hypothetical protein GCM10009077_21590 [Roseibium denhamense]
MSLFMAIRVPARHGFARCRPFSRNCDPNKAFGAKSGIAARFPQRTSRFGPHSLALKGGFV